MNILVDGRSWSHYSAGISTFFTAAVLEWARQRSDDCFFVLLPKGMDTRIEPTPLPTNIKLLDEGGRYPRWLPNIVILQLLVPRLCRKLHIGLYYAPVPHLPYGIPRKTKTMVTVHDVVISVRLSGRPTYYGQIRNTPSQKWKRISHIAAGWRFSLEGQQTDKYSTQETLEKSRKNKSGKNTASARSSYSSRGL